MRVSRISLLVAGALIAALSSCRKNGLDLDLTDASSSDDSSSSVSTVDPVNTSDELDESATEYIVSVSYSAGGANVAFCKADGTAVDAIDSLSVAVSGAGVTVTNVSSKFIHYILSGSSSAGFFKLYSGRKQEIELSNLSLTGSSGAAINNQSDKRTYIVLSGSNFLSDGGSYGSVATSDGGTEDERGAFFSEGQLCFSGAGSLVVTASAADGKGGIFSDDYIRFLGGSVSVTASKGHGIRGKDAVIVSDGSVSVNCSAAGKKAITSDGFYQQDGGTVVLGTSGAAVYDSEEKDQDRPTALKCDGDFVMNAGTLSAEATGSGGKAIKCGANIVVKGGSIYGSSASHEGITCDGTWTQSGGVVIAEGYDDAVNSAKAMTVSGGYLRGTSSGNDGIDANAAITVSGGVVIGEGANGAECGIDSVEGTSVTVNGGYVISRGGNINAFVTTASKAFVQTSVSAGAKIGLKSGDSALIAYQAPSSGGTSTLICAPELKSGSSYTLYSGVTVSVDDDSFPRFGTSFTGGSEGSSLTASSSAGGSMGGGPGGGGPGGGGHGRF